MSVLSNLKDNPETSKLLNIMKTVNHPEKRVLGTS